MGQLFLPDNIPTLVVASTTSVTIATTNLGLSTRFQIGGQQYVPASTMTLTTSGTGANGLDTGSLGAIQLWYVYAIVNNSSFVPALIASLAAPSTGPLMPSGYGTAYKLVGAFYTNGSSLVGVSVPLQGGISTAEMTWSPTIVGWTPSNVVAKFAINGEYMLGRLTYNTATPTSSTASFSLPGSWTTSDGTSLNNGNPQVIGQWTGNSGTVNTAKLGSIIAPFSTSNILQFSFTDNTLAAAPVTAQTGTALPSGVNQWEINFRCRIDQLVGKNTLT